MFRELIVYGFFSYFFRLEIEDVCLRMRVVFGNFGYMVLLVAANVSGRSVGWLSIDVCAILAFVSRFWNSDRGELLV